MTFNLHERVSLQRSRLTALLVHPQILIHPTSSDSISLTRISRCKGLAFSPTLWTHLFASVVHPISLIHPCACPSTAHPPHTPIAYRAPVPPPSAMHSIPAFLPFSPTTAFHGKSLHPSRRPQNANRLPFRPPAPIKVCLYTFYRFFHNVRRLPLSSQSP